MTHVSHAQGSHNFELVTPIRPAAVRLCSPTALRPCSGLYQRTSRGSEAREVSANSVFSEFFSFSGDPSNRCFSFISFR